MKIRKSFILKNKETKTDFFGEGRMENIEKDLI
jgi:hypothetical protein